MINNLKDKVNHLLTHKKRIATEKPSGPDLTDPRNYISGYIPSPEFD